jgi:iron complex outermembrane receptor protein
VAHIGWERGAWSARLVNRFKRGYADSNTNLLDPAVFGHNRVGNWSVFDASISLRNTDGLTLTAGLLNIFDKDPPFSNQQATLQTGYEPRVASPIGRALFVQASFRFQ